MNDQFSEFTELHLAAIFDTVHHFSLEILSSRGLGANHTLFLPTPGHLPSVFFADSLHPLNL